MQQAPTQNLEGASHEQGQPHFDLALRPVPPQFLATGPGPPHVCQSSSILQPFPFIAASPITAQPGAKAFQSLPGHFYPNQPPVPRGLRTKMAAAVESFNFHTPSMDSALISGAEFPFGLPGTSASEFAEKSFGMDHAPDAFGFDPSFESESDPQHGFPGFHSLTPPGPLEQTFINPSAPSLPQIHTSQHMPHAQMQYGQYTPGTDVAPSGSKFPSPARDVRIKQESDESSQIASPKRKRSAASESSQAGPKRRRASRKHSEAESLDPAEGEKRNKFLERNRVAASKCRQKKKEWTQNLEVMARELQANKTQLSLLVSSLKEEVMWLKGEMLKHSDCNCHHIREYLSREAETIATGSRGDNGTGGRISPTNPNTLTGEETRDYAADWESDHRDSISDVSSTWKDGDASETIQEDPEVGTSG